MREREAGPRVPDEDGLSTGLSGLEEGTVVARPNRFLAVVRLDGDDVLAHVAHSGRLKELYSAQYGHGQGGNPPEGTVRGSQSSP